MINVIYFLHYNYIKIELLMNKANESVISGIVSVIPL